MPITAHQRAVIERAYMDMPHMHYGFGECRKTLLRKCEAEERKHRSLAPTGTQWAVGFGPHMAAKYFAVKWLRDEYVSVKSRTPRDYLSTRESVFYCAALIDYFRTEESEGKTRDALATWVRGISPEFLALDYEQMVKV